LREQKTSDGRPRLKMGAAEAVDARQYIRHESLRDDDGRQYDMVILDAFTDGSTIPPHLMTREFFAEVADIMPEDGILFSNIIGSYTGPQHRVLGGAIRAQHAAGLVHIHNMPLKRQDRSFDPSVPRNNLLMASAQAIGPQQRADAWSRLADWQPYPELPMGRYVSRLVSLYDDQRARSVAVPVSEDAAYRELSERLRSRASATRSRQNSMWFAIIEDPDLIAQVGQMVLDGHPNARGWSRIPAYLKLQYLEVDWVHHARAAWAGTIGEARRQLPGRILVHDKLSLIGEDGRGGALEHSIPRVPLFTDARPNADIFNR
ncbi:MAG: hypothetical protein EA401_04095, partial [Planctomycetota bacterium]